MRVAYISMEFPGPSETFTSNDVAVLQERGIDISVHALRPAHPAASRLAVERNIQGVRITHGGAGSTLKGLGIGFLRARILFRLVAFVIGHTWSRPEHMVKSLLLAPRALHIFSTLEQDRPEVVHLCWGHYPSLVGHLVQAYLPDMVVSISLAAYDLDMEYGGSVPVAREADMVRTQARVNVEHITRFCGIPPDRVSVLYDGVDLRRFCDTDVASAKISKRIVTAGRLTPAKGMSDALRVFADVLQWWPDASLVVLGQGPELGRLKALAASLGIERAVTFRGHVSHDVVCEEMLKAEIFLFMSKSKSERLPNVVKEAIRCRCLCVVTDTPGIEELLRNHTHGYVVAQGDMASATRYIVGGASAGPRMIEHMVEAAYRHVERHFDLHVIMAQYDAMWQSLVLRKRNRLPDSDFRFRRSTVPTGSIVAP